MQIKFECVQEGGADTLKYNLHIIGHAKKGCEFNQKRCKFKIFHKKTFNIIFHKFITNWNKFQKFNFNLGCFNLFYL
jgi:hypothetical protein